MNKLPQRLPIDQMQVQWAANINPVLSNPMVFGLQLSDIPLTIGSNIINHKLGKKLQGWVLVRKSASADIFDTQAINQMPQLTLNLTSDADVTVSLWVY